MRSSGGSKSWSPVCPRAGGSGDAAGVRPGREYGASVVARQRPCLRSQEEFVQPFASHFSLLRRLRQFTRNLKSTCNLTRLTFCGALLGFATAAFAATTVTVLSPNTDACYVSALFYAAG